ncbi:DNA-binding protein [Streptomyces sp. C10-9-1]|uniref:DNA-binding protein n=1 Tax=Streptomyces sp. C10-9-1 TaxID=1859285 RepID=UPI003F49E8A4
MTAWTREAVEALGPTTDVPTLAAIVDANSDTIYALIRRGDWTMTRVLRLGRKIKIPTRDVIAYLYGPEPTPQAAPGVPSQCQHDASPQAEAIKPHTSCGCTPTDSAVIRPLRGA